MPARPPARLVRGPSAAKLPAAKLSAASKPAMPLFDSPPHAPADAHAAPSASAAPVGHAAPDAHADHAVAAHGAEGHAAHADPQPLDHVTDTIFRARTKEQVPDGIKWVTNDWPLNKTGMLPTFTLHMGTLLVASALTLITMWWVSKRMQTTGSSDPHRKYLPKGRLSQIVESVIVYLRDEMIVPILGEQNSRRYLPFLLTVFFFIWFNNLFGLLPLLDFQHLLGGLGWHDYHWAIIGGTATGNIAVTAALATIAFVVIQAHGFRELGVIGWINHLRCDAPWYAAPLIMLVEFAGLFIKPAALAIRLFANMLAGHVLMATVMLFGFMALSAGLGWFVGGAVGVVSGVFATALYFLELFVATLQAFVFMFLVAVFMSLMNHHDEHEDEHGHAEAHDQSVGQHRHDTAPAPGH